MSEEQSEIEKCRICFNRGEEGKKLALLSPCKCSGTIKWICAACYQKDLTYTRFCRTCGEIYPCFRYGVIGTNLKFSRRSVVDSIVGIVFLLGFFSWAFLLHARGA